MGATAVRGGELRTWHWGEPDRPDVLLLHGASDHGRVWDGGAAVLRSLGLSVMAVDLRGHGDSTASAASAGLSQECDVLTVLAGLPGPVGIIGHSMGGRLGIVAAGILPWAVRWLVTIDGLAASREVGDPARTVPLVLDRIRQAAVPPAAPRVYRDLDEMTRSRGKVNPRIPERWMSHLVAHGSVATPGGLRWKSERPRILPAEVETVRRQIGAVTCRTLVVLGAAIDRWGTAASPDLLERVGWFADARSVAIADAGHYPHLERPAETWAAIVEFIGAEG